MLKLSAAPINFTPWLSLGEVAECLGVTDYEVIRLATFGPLVAYRIAGQLLVRSADLEVFLAMQVAA